MITQNVIEILTSSQCLMEAKILGFKVQCGSYWNLSLLLCNLKKSDYAVWHAIHHILWSKESHFLILHKIIQNNCHLVYST